MNSKWLFYWRIATSAVGLAKGSFFVRGLPPPTDPIYLNYSVKAPQSQGGLTRQGYTNIRILWAEMDGLQLKTLRGLVETGISNGSLYLTIDRGDGTGIQNDFVDIHGLPQPVTYSTFPGARGVVFQKVELFINAVEIDNDPSTVL